MAQESDSASYIDVDRTVIRPSPHRVRNILTLDERVAAIKAYACRPMYTKVAKMFNCSWEQIKNIIINRDAIMEFYEATKGAKGASSGAEMDIRQRKLRFLGECIYEFIQRAQFHAKSDVTEELIRMKAHEFRDIIQIENFMPNKQWINHFKATYNISLSNRQITLTRTPPASLDLKDIMTYCTKNAKTKTMLENVDIPKEAASAGYRTTTRIAMSSAIDSTIQELEKRRLRKLNFLEKALSEYVQRAQHYHKSTPLDDEALRRVARDLNDMLKVQNFVPSNTWLSEFKARHHFNPNRSDLPAVRRAPLSLDLKDILSYCSRMENKEKANTVTLAPKEASFKVALPPKASALPAHAGHAGHAGHAAHQPSAHRTLINRSLNAQPNTRIKNVIYVDDEDEGGGGGGVEEVPVAVAVDDADADEVDVKPVVDELKVEPPCVASSPPPQPPPLKIRKIESINADCQRYGGQTVHSPGHWSEHSDREEDEAELPRQVRDRHDALRLLKPLEEYAMLRENYRAIGLISQLEEIFKSSDDPPADEDFED